MQEILDAILAENYDAIGGIDVPDHYRGVTVREDEADMFAGLPARDKDRARASTSTRCLRRSWVRVRQSWR
jgi:hypothetical protein